MKKFLFLAFVAVLMMAAACNEPLDEAEENTLPTNEGEVTSEDVPLGQQGTNSIHYPQHEARIGEVAEQWIEQVYIVGCRHQTDPRLSQVLPFKYGRTNYAEVRSCTGCGASAV